MHVRTAAALLAAAAALAAPAAAPAADPPPGAAWTETYFPASDGTKLHADILRDKTVPLDAAHQQPVILTVSPYVGHSAPAGTNFDPQASGPSNRFYDFVNGAGILQKGYTYIMVDLPGFGGSGGCTDWGGPNEQHAVKSAVEWAASQPWSTGKVGMYGKSYDGWTGLMGMVQQPKGLAAVVSQEPVYSGYLYEYMNGIRISGTWDSEWQTFDTLDAQPGTVNDTTDYNTNGAQTQPWCLATNAIGQMGNDDANSPFWSQRNLIPAAKGVTTPLLMTQGFLENNTKPDGAWDFFNNVAGPKRGWFGQWDHVRGNDATGNKLAMGRPGWFDEVMRFYDQYLKDEAPAVADPKIAVQDGNGRWRREDQWPPADSHDYATTLNPGSYADDNSNAGSGSSGGHGIWTISDPLPYDVDFSGVPRLSVDTQTTLPNANLVADVYDISPDNKAILISRGGYLLRSGGLHSFDLYGADWPIPAGHRLGVLISGSNSEWFTHVPTRQTVTVDWARITLPFLHYKRTPNLAGSSSIKLASWRASAPFAVDPATVTAAKAPFTLPDPLEQP